MGAEKIWQETTGCPTCKSAETISTEAALARDSTLRAGGIIIPDSAKEKPLRGTVLAAGVGKSNDEGERVPMDVKTGDTILFGKYSGQEVTVDGIDYLMMKEDDVLALQEGNV